MPGRMSGRCAFRLRKRIHCARERGFFSWGSAAGSGPLVARRRQVHAPCKAETGHGHQRHGPTQAHRCRVLGYKGARRKRLALRNARTAKKQNVAVGVLELESTQAIMGIFEWFGKLHMARRKFCCQRVRIGNTEVRVPTRPAFFDVSLVVRKWFYTHVLEHDHRGAALDNAKEDVIRFGPQKRDLEPETVAIKRQRGRDIPDDEEWRNAGNFWFRHVALTQY